jgi:hypothetical protein
VNTLYSFQGSVAVRRTTDTTIKAMAMVAHARKNFIFYTGHTKWNLNDLLEFIIGNKIM